MGIQLLGPLADTVYKHKYAFRFPDGSYESWDDTARRVAYSVMQPPFHEAAHEVYELIRDRKFMPGGRYLYAAGRKYHQCNNCALFSVDDSRTGWAELVRRSTHALMTGMGIGVVYSDLRPEGSSVAGLGGKATGPCSLMKILNETGRYIQQGGSRRSAIWAGLHWNHPDVWKFISLKDWPDWMAKAKREDFNAAATMDGTNISVILDDHFFHAYHSPTHRDHSHARQVYVTVVERMCRTGEPGFSVDVGKNAGEHLRNACTEIVSRDNNEICNLASLVLPRFDSLDEFSCAVDLAILFLFAGTFYSDLPIPEFAATREKNRRIGLGLMGFHEWLLLRGKRYAPDADLAKWLAVYQQRSDETAKYLASTHSVAFPVGRRAIAPTGTIAIVAETTSAIEPIFAVAFKRRYLKGDAWHAQFTIEAAAERLIKQGVDPDSIEDAYSLAADPARRLGFQKFVQEYVDQGISSTLNLPAWGSDDNNPDTITKFADTIFDHLPFLRGVTAYPDGARGGQPLTVVPYSEAIQKAGVEFIEYGNETACPGGVCGV